MSVASCHNSAVVITCAASIVLALPYGVGGLPGTMLGATTIAANVGKAHLRNTTAPAMRAESWVDSPQNDMTLAQPVRMHATLVTAGMATESAKAPDITDDIPPFPAKWRKFRRDAWSSFMYAKKGGAHRRLLAKPVGFTDRLKLAWKSAANVDWCYLAVLIGLLVTMDLAVFQQLPETVRTNLVLLVFWILVGCAVAMELWLRLGPADCMRWSVAYLMELVYSVDRVFMSVLIIQTLDTPRRLLAKVMFIALMGSWFLRSMFVAGLASALAHFRVISYLAGAWLIYCGIRQVAVIKGPEYQGCVTEALPIRALRAVLGRRFDQYYDEEGESMFLIGKQGIRMTLLGAVLLCLLSSDLVLSLDVTLAKEEKFQSLFIDFSSSVIAAFAIRAFIFVVRDVFATYELAQLSLGPILIFLGVEALLSHELYVNALLCACIVFTVLGISVTLSIFQTAPEPKVMRMES